MRTYDLTPLYRSFVGLDRMANLIDAASQYEGTGGYPPYNVAQLNEDAYRIELAVAGFSDQEIDIESYQNVLTVTGRKVVADNDGEDSTTYLHRGIAERGFERRFQLADHVFVEKATLENGMLVISLKRELPEALKPRKIAIGHSGSQKKDDEKLITSKASRKTKAA